MPNCTNFANGGDIHFVRAHTLHSQTSSLLRGAFFSYSHVWRVSGFGGSQGKSTRSRGALFCLHTPTVPPHNLRKLTWPHVGHALIAQSTKRVRPSIEAADLCLVECLFRTHQLASHRRMTQDFSLRVPLPPFPIRR